MNNCTTVLANINHLLPISSLDQAVTALSCDRYVKSFSTKNLFLVLLTAQVKQWNTLREIETGFTYHRSNLYHLGLKKVPPRSTIADANERTPPEVFERLFADLVCRTLSYSSCVPKQFKKVTKIIDSSLIDVCLSVFDWASFRTTKGAIKLHALFNLTTQIPEVICVTDGRCHDTKCPILDDSRHFSDSIIIMDRGYQDFALFKRIHDHRGVFITRLKKNIRYEVIGQQNIYDTSVTGDFRIRLIKDHSHQAYPGDLRLVIYTDEDGKTYQFLTNNFRYRACNIAQLYKNRWQIELFFKWIKQNLKIKTFLGTSRNAVINQILVAMICYTLIRYVIYQCNYHKGALYLSRVLREVLFERGTVIDFLKCNTGSVPDEIPQIQPQYGLFDSS